MGTIQDGTAVAKSCSKCGADTRLIVRTNSRNGAQFLGCPNWPACAYTEPLPESLRMQLLGQPRLL